MKRLAFTAFTLTLLIVSFWIVALADNSQFQLCRTAGNSAELCAACNNPSRGSGTSGSTADCLCETQLTVLGQPAFNDTYGNFGECLRLQHSQGIN